ncbi:MAG TPA: Gfo/Idh/MocA family oxidoreductase [Gammaproteobacteria bacterium]|nr:Gfo/Idh/MocA family oxidoreductase [Gammaproteobacteria bacterium]
MNTRPVDRPLRTAVIGVGYLGRFHAQKYGASPMAELVGVVDADARRGEEVAAELGCEFFAGIDALPAVDAVSIVVPTQLHYDIAHALLANGTHVLLEKPMTTTVAEAQTLIDTARANDTVLQIGHLERFNPAILALDGVLNEPLFIESHRVAPFNPRGADVNVVLDLMIHDIDIILDIVGSEVEHMDVSGVPVLSDDIDIANARLRFANGCIANVTASRAGMKSERKMRIFQHDAYLSVDFQNRKLGVHRKGAEVDERGIPQIESEQQSFEAGDALRAEIDAFLDAIINGTPPVVSGEDGMNALKAAIAITDMLGNR